MPDQKPPRLDGDERETLHALLQYQRESFVRKVTGVSEEQARVVLVGSGTNLLWLTRHLARAETVWMQVRFAGRSVTLPDDDVHPDDTVADAADAYRRTWLATDAESAAAPSLDARCRGVDDGAPANLRWVLMHLLEITRMTMPGASMTVHVSVLPESTAKTTAAAITRAAPAAGRMKVCGRWRSCQKNTGTTSSRVSLVVDR